MLLHRAACCLAVFIIVAKGQRIVCLRTFIGDGVNGGKIAGSAHDQSGIYGLTVALLTSLYLLDILSNLQVGTPLITPAAASREIRPDPASPACLEHGASPAWLTA